MITYRYSVKADFPLIFDTANRIFSSNEEGTRYDPTYFADIQPKLYANEDLMPPHLMAFDGERPVGIAAVKIQPLHMASQTVLLGSVGTVGVIPQERGKGIMSEMMNRINADLEAGGATLGELGGKRSRYSHFGYVTGGYGLEFQLVPGDVSAFSAEGYVFEEILDAGRQEETELFLSLYEKTVNRAARSKTDFLLSLRSGRRRAFRILKDRTVTGYLSADSDLKGICEMEIQNSVELPHTLNGYFRQTGISVLQLYGISAMETEKLAFLMPFATSVKLTGRERYRIFDYRTLVEKGLLAKAEAIPLANGTVTFAIEHYGTLTVTVKNNGKIAEVRLTDEKSNLSLTQAEASQWLCGAAFPFGRQGKTIPKEFFSWFPLPLHNRPCDRI